MPHGNCPNVPVLKIKIRGQHGAVKSGQAQLVEQVQLDAGEIAIGEEGLGVRGDGFEVQAVEQVIRSVAAAQGHDGAGVRIGKSRVQVGEALSGSSGKVERPVLERMLAWLAV